MPITHNAAAPNTRLQRTALRAAAEPPGRSATRMKMAHPWTWLVDRHVEAAFRPRSDGTVAFYPFGRWQDGYQAVTPQQVAALREAMRRYVLTYLRYGVLLILTGAAILASKELLASAVFGFSIWLLIALNVVCLLTPLAGMGIFIWMWQRRFRDVARNLKVLPPTFAQLSRVQNAATRTDPSTIKIRAAASFLIAISTLVLMIWAQPRLERWDSVVLACVVAAGLGYYVWCRAVMRAAQGSGGSGDAEKPAAPGDGKGRRA